MKQLVLCGKNSVVDAFKNGYPIEKLILQNAQNKDIFKNSKFPIEIRSKYEIDKITKENHQGFLALIKDINYYGLDVLSKDKPSIILILDHIQDPHNLGAIIRTSNAAGIKHIVLPKDRTAAINSTVIKVSSGGFINMKFIRVNSISSTLTWLKKNDFWIYATNLNSTAVKYNEAKYNFPLALIVGNEGSGVSKGIQKIIDENIYIKQNGTVQSINVSVAAGILLFEIIKEL